MSVGAVAHAEMGEQRRQVGIGRLVVDDEAGVDRDRAGAPRRLAGVGVAAEAGLGLVENDVVIPRQQPGASQT